MVPIMCLVQENQIQKETEIAIKNALNSFTLRAFEDEANIDWVIIPKGSGFRGGKLADSIFASVLANRPLEADERKPLLTELSKLLRKYTGWNPNRVVAAIRATVKTGN